MLISTGQIPPLQAPALAKIGAASLLPDLQHLALDLGDLERLVTDLRASLPTPEEVTGKLDELFVLIKTYVNSLTGGDANVEEIIEKNTENEDIAPSKEVVDEAYEEKIPVKNADIEDIPDVKDISLDNETGDVKTESTEDKGEK